MDKEKLIEQYYIKFGTFPVVMMTTQGDDEEYLKAIENAIKRNKPLTNEEIDKAYDFQFDVYIEDKDKQFKNFKKGDSK